MFTVIVPKMLHIKTSAKPTNKPRFLVKHVFQNH